MNTLQTISQHEIAAPDAWELATSGEAIIIDVRSEEEFKFVGHVPNSVLIPWAKGLNLEKNSDFSDTLKATIPLEHKVLFLCRSGKRSLNAVDAAKRLGYKEVFSIYGGFEGDKDPSGQRGKADGWRYHDLPWSQD
jgi:rhodanese-related sulfurtransferase